MGGNGFGWIAELWVEVRSNWRTAFWMAMLGTLTGLRILADLAKGNYWSAVTDVILSLGMFVVGATTGYLAGIKWTREMYESMSAKLDGRETDLRRRPPTREPHRPSDN